MLTIKKMIEHFDDDDDYEDIYGDDDHADHDDVTHQIQTRIFYG